MGSTGAVFRGQPEEPPASSSLPRRGASQEFRVALQDRERLRRMRCAMEASRLELRQPTDRAEMFARQYWKNLPTAASMSQLRARNDRRIAPILLAL